MEQKCHEFFRCIRGECPMFSEEETRNCWEVAGTFNHCMNNSGKRVSVKDKEAFCANCLYFTYRKKIAQSCPREMTVQGSDLNMNN